MQIVESSPFEEESEPYIQTSLKKPLSDFWFQSILFYKFGTQYRPWLLTFNVDLCDCLDKYPSISSLQNRLLVKNFITYTKIVKCPIETGLNVTINSDNSSDSTMYNGLPRMPEGEYKTFVRAHTMKNETIFLIELKFVAKSRMGVNRTTMLNMGQEKAIQEAFTC